MKTADKKPAGPDLDYARAVIRAEATAIASLEARLARRSPTRRNWCSPWSPPAAWW